MSLVFSDMATCWASVMVEELYRLGLRRVCLAPGSRSTPLVLAFERHDGFEVHRHFDERGLGFFALGLAKFTSQPVAILVTSGTAVANLLPALIEAHYSAIPLVVLSADRPAELQDCGANQSIRQTDIFSSYLSGKVLLPCPSEDVAIETVLADVDAAVGQMLSRRHGPVQINCPFREPFFKDSGLGAHYLAGISTWFSGNAPLNRYENDLEPVDVSEYCSFFQEADLGLFVLGDCQDEAILDKVLALSEKLGWGIIADVQSPLRYLAHGNILAYADRVLDRDPSADLLEVDSICVVGGRLTSKSLQEAMQRSRAKIWQVLPAFSPKLDPFHRYEHVFSGDVLGLFSALLSSINSSNASSVVYNDLSKAVSKEIEAATLSVSRLNEVSIVRELGAVLDDDQPLFISNSMPIRLVDAWMPAKGARRQVWANRGASGIDGILASAAGVALGQDKPLLVLIGDMAFRHDLNSLALYKASEVPLLIVLINNGGGGIFSHLPVADVEPDICEQSFVMREDLSFRETAAAFGLGYKLCNTTETVSLALTDWQASPSTLVLEVECHTADTKAVMAAFRNG